MNNSRIGNSSLHAVDRAVYSAPVVDSYVSNLITHSVRDRTLFRSSPVSLV